MAGMNVAPAAIKTLHKRCSAHSVQGCACSDGCTGGGCCRDGSQLLRVKKGSGSFNSPFDIFDYIEPLYNRKRLHSTLGFASPANFLQHWINAQHEQKVAA